MIFKHVSISSLLLLLIFFYTSATRSQTDYSAEVELMAQGSTQEKVPFWMYSNKRGRISPETNAVGLVAARIQHQLGSEAILEIGGGGVVHNGFQKKLALDEVYLQFRNRYFYITGGVKQKKKLYNGLSATNENILWSLNARPLPGIEIGTQKPVFIFPGIGFEGRWGEYILEEDRHVPWARVHHKKFNVVIQPAENWQIKAGIQHFSQWGGVSPEWGTQPEGFIDYLRILSGSAGGKNAEVYDQANLLGNHLGSWIFETYGELGQSTLGFIFNSLFEDGTGSRFANFPDGEYGLLWKNRRKFVRINFIVYNFFYSKNQSNNANSFGPDDYFNHGTYRSGWSYFGKVIGAPFFLYDKGQDRIINNKFTAHHLGISGNLGTFYDPYPYKLLMSYRINEGTYAKDIIPADKEPHILSTYFTARLYNGDFELDTPRLTLDFLFAADFNSLLDPNFGAGVSLKYNFSGQ